MAPTPASAGNGAYRQSQETSSKETPAMGVSKAVADAAEKVVNVANSIPKPWTLVMQQAIKSLLNCNKEAAQDIWDTAEKATDPAAKAELYVRPFRKHLEKAKAVLPLIPNTGNGYKDAQAHCKTADTMINKWEGDLKKMFEPNREARKQQS